MEMVSLRFISTVSINANHISSSDDHPIPIIFDRFLLFLLIIGIPRSPLYNDDDDDDDDDDDINGDDVGDLLLSISSSGKYARRS